MHTWVWKPTKLIMNRLPGGNDAHLSMKANKIDYESFTWLNLQVALSNHRSLSVNIIITEC